MLWYDKYRVIQNVRHLGKRGMEIDKKSNENWHKGSGRS